MDGRLVLTSFYSAAQVELMPPFMMVVKISSFLSEISYSAAAVALGQNLSK